MLEGQRKAQEYREKQQQEKKRKLEEMRRREEDHRRTIEERRKKLLEEETVSTVNFPNKVKYCTINVLYTCSGNSSQTWIIYAVRLSVCLSDLYLIYQSSHRSNKWQISEPVTPVKRLSRRSTRSEYEIHCGYETQGRRHIIIPKTEVSVVPQKKKLGSESFTRWLAPSLPSPLAPSLPSPPLAPSPPLPPSPPRLPTTCMGRGSQSTTKV